MSCCASWPGDDRRARDRRGEVLVHHAGVDVVDEAGARPRARVEHGHHQDAGHEVVDVAGAAELRQGAERREDLAEQQDPDDRLDQRHHRSPDLAQARDQPAPQHLACLGEPSGTGGCGEVPLKSDGGHAATPVCECGVVPVPEPVEVSPKVWPTKCRYTSSRVGWDAETWPKRMPAASSAAITAPTARRRPRCGRRGCRRHRMPR